MMQSLHFGCWEIYTATTIILTNEVIISFFLCNFSSRCKARPQAFILHLTETMNKLHPKGNILLMTLFVLFASALLGVFVSLMMRDFLKYSNEIAHYHQANALAKSASELGFYLIWESNVGFNFNDSEWISQLIDQNITCPLQQNEEEKKEWKCWIPRSMDLKITGLKDQISTTLWPGKSLIVPGFYNTVANFAMQTWTWDPDPELTQKENSAIKTSNITIHNDIPVIEEGTPWSRNSNQYLVITNLNTRNTHEIKLNREKLFDGNISMKVSGSYGEKQVSRNFELKKGLPEFLQSDNYLN